MIHNIEPTLLSSLKCTLKLTGIVNVTFMSRYRISVVGGVVRKSRTNLCFTVTLTLTSLPQSSFLSAGQLSPGLTLFQFPLGQQRQPGAARAGKYSDLSRSGNYRHNYRHQYSISITGISHTVIVTARLYLHWVREDDSQQ